ncbi:MAG: immunoglobulin domain-containing protein [Verrucomicrobia bacterium]|nr:immunoglobulin domain-containing protein [Verrucomicrobiota bacterium]
MSGFLTRRCWQSFTCLVLGSALSSGRLQGYVVDTTFDPGTDAGVWAVAVQPDGKILVCGMFYEIAGAKNQSYLARLNANGSIDPTFAPQLNAPVQVMALQADGKIIIGGSFSVINGTIQHRLARLNPNGSLDVDYKASMGEGSLYALLLQSDGRLLMGGRFDTVGGQTRRGIARLLSDGRLDTTFQADVATSVPQSLGAVSCIARQPDGMLIFGGSFTKVNERAQNGAVRVSEKGELDSSFRPPFADIQGSVSIGSVVIQRDGMIVFGGAFTLPGDFSHSNLLRCRSDGSLDASFAPAPNGPAGVRPDLDDSGIFVMGGFTSIAGSSRSGMVRLRKDGSVDETFNFEIKGSIGVITTGLSLVHAGGGQILFGGSFANFGGVARKGLARIVPPEPSFASHPANVTVTAGANTTFTAVVLGQPPTYQWRKDGVALAGATNASLTVSAVRPQDAGRFDVVVTNSAGTATSSAAILTVNFAPVITTQPAALSVVSGQPAALAVIAAGTPAPAYQWRREGVAMAGATSAQFTLAAAKTTDAGRYDCVVTNAIGSVTTAAAELTVVARARLGNLSVRTTLARGENVVVGFVVAGGATEMLVRAVGPTLQQFGLTTAMADPRLELYRESNKLLENDDWSPVLATVFSRVGAFAFVPNSRDAALLQSLGGAHSIVAGGSGPGVVLVEAYDTGTAEGPRLANLSARNQVGTGDDVLIVGFSVAGSGTMRVLMRAVGPTIGGVPFNVPGVLADPKLELRNASGLLIGENDTWDAGLSPTFASVGAFGLAAGGKDAALTATLAGGNSYTAVVRGADGGTGVALVEIYELP